MMASAAAAAVSPEPELIWQKAGQTALAATTCSEKESLSRATFSPVSGSLWPRNFQATSVGTRTGRFQVWTAAAGIPLELAVAASSAFPGVWPPITIGGERYMDGGLRSSLNADLAFGHARVVIISCLALEEPPAANPAAAALNRSLRSEIESLRTGGAAVGVVAPDAAFLALTVNGTRMLDNSLVPEAYEAGRRQALDEATRVRTAWGTGQ
jgi:NTE family protein